jgi:hypothetical protein
MSDEQRNENRPESTPAKDEMKSPQQMRPSGAPANPGQETRNENANPAAGGRAERDPVEGARDEYGTKPGQTQRGH